MRWNAVMFNASSSSLTTTEVDATAGGFDDLAAPGKIHPFAFALEPHHSAYDCSYWALAEARQTQVVTADMRLNRHHAGTPFSNLVRPL